MRRSRKVFGMAVMVAGLSVGFIPALVKGAPISDRGMDYGDLRGLVDRTQSDLRAASDLEHGGKQTDRYHKAQDHLSKLDKSLSKGRYNKGALNDSIDSVKSILDHNTLQASARDALMRDLSDLKIARDRH